MIGFVRSHLRWFSKTIQVEGDARREKSTIRQVGVIRKIKALFNKDRMEFTVLDRATWKRCNMRSQPQVVRTQLLYEP